MKSISKYLALALIACLFSFSLHAGPSEGAEPENGEAAQKVSNQRRKCATFAVGTIIVIRAGYEAWLAITSESDAVRTGAILALGSEVPTAIAGLWALRPQEDDTTTMVA